MNNNEPLTIVELAGLIMKASYVIANDTGPAHMAAHLNKSGVTIFGHDMSLNITTSIKITDQFNFGISGKYIHSRIWKVNASALCLDMGTIIKTDFLQINKNPSTGIILGMSISNYGTRMRYYGI